jgi:Protein of unknown function (DUF4232)
MKFTNLTMLASIAAATIALPATAHADPLPPCSDGQVQVTNGGQQSASGHRDVVLVFSLTPGAQECTLTGYPGVDSGAGGPLIHATRTRGGFMAGMRDTDVPPTIPITVTTPGRAVVEGVALDKTDPGRTCPTYTELRVTAPDTMNAVTVPTDMDTCELQVHPMGSAAADDTFHDHSETVSYTIDITYPLDYPDMKSVSDFVNADRGYFLDWIARFDHDGPGRQYMYDVTGMTYRSAQPATTSLVLTLENDTGAAHEGHPATVYESFNYDLAKQAPITFDTLLRPDADVVSALGPKVAELYDRPTNTLLPSDFRNFALTDDAVIFFFGEGQLIPADNTGPRQISVPRSELAPLMA